MCDYRESRESWEWDNLAPYASHSSDPSLSWRRSEGDEEIAQPNSARNRPIDIHFPDPSLSQMYSPDYAGAISRFKTAFQLDKERIASSNAFRRLEYKTQVFVSHEGDHYRTRLTHTIEVNETARFVAQALQLNEDLVDAIALGHDVGHTPFGHSGEEALNKLFKKYWPDKEPLERIQGELYGPAFYHNVQSVRVVDFLEKGYEWDRRPVRKHADHGKVQYPLIARGRGLDLTWAVREGILKHSSRGLREKDEVRMYSSDYLMQELRSFQPATLEGQVIEFADEIASMMHDLEDGLRSRLFSLDDLRKELSKKLKENGEAGLAELLGLTANFAHKEPDSPRTRSRISKMEHLLEQIEIGEGKDCTVGTVLAVLRSLLISNLIEASYARLVYVMAGSKSINEIINVPSPTNHKKDMSDELIWIHFQIGAPPGPTENSYCTEAWDIEDKDIVHRKVTVQTFQRGEKGISPSSDLMPENDLQVFWTSRTTNRLESRSITVKRENGSVSVYPLGNVCITFGGAKLIGYHPNLSFLRNWLRKEFIPNHLHKASVVLRTTNKGQRWLEKLFELYYSTPNIIHRSALERFSMWARANDAVPDLQKDPRFILRIVEHLQGMTDRYLTEEYLRLFLDGTKMRETPEVNVVDGDIQPF